MGLPIGGVFAQHKRSTRTAPAVGVTVPPPTTQHTKCKWPKPETLSTVGGGGGSCFGRCIHMLGTQAPSTNNQWMTGPQGGGVFRLGGVRTGGTTHRTHGAHSARRAPTRPADWHWTERGGATAKSLRGMGQGRWRSGQKGCICCSCAYSPPALGRILTSHQTQPVPNNTVTVVHPPTPGLSYTKIRN